MKKKLLNKITKNFIAKVNARVKAYRKAGIDEAVIQDRLKQVAKVDGFAVNKKGNLVASEDINELGIMAVVRALPKAGNLAKQLSEPLEAIVSEAEKEERERIAEMEFFREVSKVRNAASDDLWDIWYSKHEGGWKHRNFEQQGYLRHLDDDIKADLADKIARLGTSMGQNDASAEEILNLYNEIKEELSKVGVKI